MLTYPEMNPVAFHVGPLSVYWYGLMYLFGILSAWILLAWRTKTSSRGFSLDEVSDIIFYGAVGMIVGGRIGYMFFYIPQDFIANPLLVFQIWKGGMSFHGGLLGVILALWLYAYHSGKSLGDITDFLVPAVPIGLGAGRIGNFINGELWGRATDVPWAMIFPQGGDMPRHPSQLYEFFLEGIVLFLILWIFSLKPRPRWAVSGLFIACYGLFRFSLEFFREPDAQIGFIAFDWLTKGQLLSLPMIIFGILVILYAYRGKITCSNI